MSYVLVLGASGFIGHHLIKRLLADGNNVIGYSRQVTEQFSECGNYVQIIGDFSSEVDFDIFFRNIRFPVSIMESLQRYLMRERSISFGRGRKTLFRLFAF